MASREHLDTLLSENRQTDRPEVRAKTSLGLVSFVSEKVLTDEAQDAEMLLQDAWIGIFRGLSDDWPLVKDAFREQLVKALGQSDEFLGVFKNGTLVDQILARMKQPSFAKDRICLLAGIMLLSDIVHSSNDAASAGTPVTRVWDVARIENIISMVMDGWIESPTADQVVRATGSLSGRFGDLAISRYKPGVEKYQILYTCSARTARRIDLESNHGGHIRSQCLQFNGMHRTSVNDPSDAALSTTSSKAAGDLHLIRVPGNFSSNILQILDQEIRPCFTNKRAERLAHRAQSTISVHKGKIRQANETGTDGSVVRHQQQSSTTLSSQQRFKIAPIGDTPNDEHELCTGLDDESERQLASQPRKWNEDFLESVAIVEWCARQPIQDSSRIHEVFMLLVGPILAMMDSPQKQLNIRGLDILTRYLVQYHHDGAGNSKGPVDPWIWIKIFQRTGIDQLLDQNLRPLLAPPPTGLTQDDEPGANVHLEALQAAFRAYLTLVMVNTEPQNQPSSAADGTRPNAHGGVHTGMSGDTNGSPLSVESLFLQGVLGSFMRANHSGEYLMLVLEWMKRLVAPVIPFDFILDQLPQIHSMMVPCSDMDSDQQSAADTETGFQGIYGMGAQTIKYLATLLQHICNIFQYPLPSPSSTGRMEALNLACMASEALYAVMEVSQPRIPRYRGIIMAAVANCWANSRIVSSEASSLPGSTPTASTSPELTQAQKRLDDGLVRLMQLCRDICQPRITGDQASGYEMDMKVLRDLHHTVFDGLFTSK
ncbi:hypothetical protein BGZ67_006642 [Mortierella alpina]|nr:hypothetical protein BGZ67_006642 [Mortierella alpina]